MGDDLCRQGERLAKQAAFLLGRFAEIDECIAKPLPTVPWLHPIALMSCGTVPGRRVRRLNDYAASRGACTILYLPRRFDD